MENHASEIDGQIHHTSLHPGTNTLEWIHDLTTTIIVTDTLILDGTTYYNVETKISTINEELYTALVTSTIIYNGETYADVATLASTDVHLDPVTALDESQWGEHTATHSHEHEEGNGGPTEYLPAHTHHHTFTILTTVTSSFGRTYTEWVSAQTITLWYIAVFCVKL
ncbi:hypothetical protein ABW19_dt0205839 [Dactylella cylindrospora]|nr:hypothetical protein ABW19_dt0205839 [Dactylella cylindrospora]